MHTFIIPHASLFNPETYFSLVQNFVQIQTTFFHIPHTLKLYILQRWIQCLYEMDTKSLK